MHIFGITNTPHIVQSNTPFMWSLLAVLFVELAAAIAGTIHIRKHPVQKVTRYLVYFLWLTVAIEYFFSIARLCVFQLESLHFLRDSLLIQNIWAYNIYSIISGLFYIYYFKEHIASRKIKLLLKIMMLVFFGSYIISLIVTESYFIRIQANPELIVALFILVSVMLYYYDKVQDNNISAPLNINVFVGLGVIIFHMLQVPLLIYLDSEKTSEFTMLLRGLLVIACILLYGLYTIGFLVCLGEKKVFNSTDAANYIR